MDGLCNNCSTSGKCDVYSLRWAPGHAHVPKTSTARPVFASITCIELLHFISASSRGTQMDICSVDPASFVISVFFVNRGKKGEWKNSKDPD
jgi:hypothetical protein